MFYYVIEACGQRHGPYSREMIADMLQQGELSSEALLEEMQSGKTVSASVVNGATQHAGHTGSHRLIADPRSNFQPWSGDAIVGFLLMLLAALGILIGIWVFANGVKLAELEELGFHDLSEMSGAALQVGGVLLLLCYGASFVMSVGLMRSRKWGFTSLLWTYSIVALMTLIDKAWVFLFFEACVLIYLSLRIWGVLPVTPTSVRAARPLNTRDTADSAAPSSGSRIEALERLAKLKESGHISQSEYQAEKERVLR
jgi:hypothetical protein